MKRLWILLLGLILTACTGNSDYIPPTATPEMLIQRPADAYKGITAPIRENPTASVPGGINYLATVKAKPQTFYDDTPKDPLYHEPKNLATPTSATACRIKGNVSWRNNDEKIYHCPNWRDYDRTQVNWHDGDRWFCTEAEAIEAGFRKPENVTDPCIP